MHAFSGAVLGSEHDADLPTVAQIDEDSLILSSQEGRIGVWQLDQVQIIEVGNGYFEVVAEDRRLSLVVDEPEAFEKALEAELARRTLIAGVHPDTTQVPLVGRPKRAMQRQRATSRFLRSFSSRPRHGRASVRPLPLTVAVAVVLTLGYLSGSFVGDLLRVVTTESPRLVQTPSAEVVVREFQGSGDGTTSPFVVQARWELRWSLQGAEGARLEVLVLTEDGGSNAVVVQEGPDSGTVPLREAGVFQLETRSTDGAEWTVRVVQLANVDSG